MFAATFVAYPARHLLLGPEEPDPRVGPATSWWRSDPVEVPVSLRERGDRAIRGRSSRVPDPTLDRQRLAALAEREAELRRTAAAELAAAGRLHRSHLSPAARDLLLDQLSTLLGRHQTETHDSDLGLVLRAEPGPDTVVYSEDGTTTVGALTLTAARAPGSAEPAREAAS